MASHGTIVSELVLSLSLDTSSLTFNTWGQMHVLRVNNMHMRETPENTLNNYIRAEGPVATVLGQEPALSNASEQPL